jgi:Sigma 54 modulation/S30EA ribosomal protein C terminus
LASEHVDDFVVPEPSRYSEPISLADARSEMDVLDRRFVYFIALEDQHGKVLCLRHDGDYGLVELDPPLPAPRQPTFLRALDHSAPGDLLAEEVTFSSPFADYHGRAECERRYLLQRPHAAPCRAGRVPDHRSCRGGLPPDGHGGAPRHELPATAGMVARVGGGAEGDAVMIRRG